MITALDASNAARSDALSWVICEKKEFLSFIPSVGAASDCWQDVLAVLEQYVQAASRHKKCNTFGQGTDSSEQGMLPSGRRCAAACAL